MLDVHTYKLVHIFFDHRCLPSDDSSVFTLFAHPLEFTALALQLGLVGVKLPLLIGLFDFLALQLIANQCPGSQAERAADRGAGARMAHRSAA